MSPIVPHPLLLSFLKAPDGPKPMTVPSPWAGQAVWLQGKGLRTNLIRTPLLSGSIGDFSLNSLRLLGRLCLSRFENIIG